MDNLEQVLDCAPLIAELLGDLPQLNVIATSRERLAITFEQEYPVPPLDQTGAQELFVSRARQIAPDFEPDETVSEICERLDRLPLALELASTRVKLMSTAQILGGSSSALICSARAGVTRPTGTRPYARRSRWSYDLLSEAEQTLFRGLRVFAGSFELEAAEAVCGAGLDDLQSLIEKSLLRRDGHGRFFLLELTSEYALEQLQAAEEAERPRRQHADWFLRLTRLAREHLHSAEQGDWFARFEADVDNLRAAVVWYSEHDPAGAIDLATTLYWPWRMHGRLPELISCLEGALAATATVNTRSRAVGLRTLVEALSSTNELDRIREPLEQSLALCRELGDTSPTLCAGLEQSASLAVTAAPVVGRRLALCVPLRSPAMAQRSADEDRLLEACAGGQIVLQQGVGETLAARREDPEASARRLRADDHIAGVSGQSGRRRDVGVARLVVGEVEAWNRSPCRSRRPARNRRDRRDRAQTHGHDRDRARPPAGIHRDNPAAASASIDREERVPADRPKSAWRDHKLVGAPRPGVAADPLHPSMRVDRVHLASSGFRAARTPGRRKQPVAEAADGVERQRSVCRRRVVRGEGREHSLARAVRADLVDLVVRRVAEDRTGRETVPANREDAPRLLHQPWHRRKPMQRATRRRRGPDRVRGVLDVQELPASPDDAVQLLRRLRDDPEPQRLAHRKRIGRRRRRATGPENAGEHECDRADKHPPPTTAHPRVTPRPLPRSHCGRHSHRPH